MKFIINTVTEEKGEPTPAERRGRAKLVMNVKEHAFIVDVPKLAEGQTVDLRAWDDYVASRLQLIKHMIDKKLITERGINQKLLDDFGPHPKK